MIIGVNLFIRDRNYLFYLLLQRYVTQKVARSWRIGAQHTLSPPGPHTYTVHRVYLDNVHNVLICFVFGVIILQWRVDRYGITRHQQSNLGPSQHCNLLSQSTLPEDHCSQKFLQSSCGWRNLIPFDHIVSTHFQIHIWFLYPYRRRLE